MNKFDLVDQQNRLLDQLNKKRVPQFLSRSFLCWDGKYKICLITLLIILFSVISTFNYSFLKNIKNGQFGICAAPLTYQCHVFSQPCFETSTRENELFKQNVNPRAKTGHSDTIINTTVFPISNIERTFVLVKKNHRYQHKQ